MYEGDGDGSGQAFGGLEPAGGGVDCSNADAMRPANAPGRTPSAPREELIRLRSVIDRLELQFSSVAAAFAATEENEWQGHVSPIQWIRNQCGMTAAAAWKAQKAAWHALAPRLGLQGSHLLSEEETLLGDTRLIDVRGTGKRASHLASADLAERIGEIEMIPAGRIDVTQDRIPGIAKAKAKA